MGTIEARLKELGVVLPPPRPMPANFIPATVLGEICWLSGTIGTIVNANGRARHSDAGQGRPRGHAGARLCLGPAMRDQSSGLAQARARRSRPLQRILKLTGYVNAVDGYKQAARRVVNGASDFLVELLGPERGAHSRVAVSVAGLAFDAPVLKPRWSCRCGRTPINSPPAAPPDRATGRCASVRRRRNRSSSSPRRSRAHSAPPPAGPAARPWPAGSP